MHHLGTGFTVGFRLAAVGLGVCYVDPTPAMFTWIPWQTLSMHSKSRSNSHTADPCHTLAGSHSTVTAAFSSSFSVVWHLATSVKAHKCKKNKNRQKLLKRRWIIYMIVSVFLFRKILIIVNTSYQRHSGRAAGRHQSDNQETLS